MGDGRLISRRLLAALVVTAGFATKVQAASPPRIVSLNPCLDAILIAVADPGQILAVSHYAREAGTSDIAAEAARFPITYETAEEVLALKPDLVLETGHNSPATLEALAGLGIRSVVLTVPDRISDNLHEIRTIAALAGHPDRGEALVGRIEDALADAAPAPGEPKIDAVVFQRNGFVAGAGTLVDEMLSRTGFRNMAARYGVTDWATIPLERLIADPPALLLSDSHAGDRPDWADRVLRHPALAALGSRMRRADFPERLLYCGGPSLIHAAKALKAARIGYRVGRTDGTDRP